MSFDRLSFGHVLAAVAALALLFVMAMDWYTTKRGEELRRIQESFEGSRAPEAQREERAARLKAEDEERNAWQADGAIDRLVLVVLLATVAGALFGAGARAAGRRTRLPWTAAAVVAALALLGEALVAYRIVQEPGDDRLTEISLGAPLALGCLALIAVGALRAARAEEEAPEPAQSHAQAAAP